MEVDTILIARQAISKISERFPLLEMQEDVDDPVELSIKMPLQSGLKQSVWLALQNNDELTFGVGEFQVEWFPCTDEKKANEFIEAVSSYLEGSSRIMEHYRGKRCVKAELQIPNGSEWETIATWSLLWWPFPFSKTYREVSNA